MPRWHSHRRVGTIYQSAPPPTKSIDRIVKTARVKFIYVLWNCGAYIFKNSLNKETIYIIKWIFS